MEKSDGDSARSPLAEPSDEELVERAREGSIHAFEVLVRRYQPRIRGFLEKQLGNSEDAEDVTQRTFLQVYSGLDRFKPGHQFRAWLFTIARRRGIDFLRQLGTRQKMEQQFRDEQLPDSGPNPRTVVGGMETVDELWLWISDRLDARSREILWLKIQEELEIKEIAKIVKLTQTHVKVLLHRARKTLVEAFSRTVSHPGTPSVAQGQKTKAHFLSTLIL